MSGVWYYDMAWRKVTTGPFCLRYLNNVDLSSLLILVTCKNMKLVVPSATIAVLHGAEYVHADKFGVATSIDLAYETVVDNSSLRKPKRVLYEPYLINQECTFLSVLEQTTADSGILGCGTGSICIEDTLSSLGGRCVSALDSEERQMQSCVKCTGTKACLGLTTEFKNSFVGCGSCIGDYACAFVCKFFLRRNSWLMSVTHYHSCLFVLTDSSTIGQDSCIGSRACYLLANGNLLAIKSSRSEMLSYYADEHSF